MKISHKTAVALIEGDTLVSSYMVSEQAGHSLTEKHQRALTQAEKCLQGWHNAEPHRQLAIQHVQRISNGGWKYDL